MNKKKKRGEEPRGALGGKDGGETSETWGKEGQTRHKWFRKRKKGGPARRSRFDDETEENNDDEDRQRDPNSREGHGTLTATVETDGEKIMAKAAREAVWGIASAIDIYDCDPERIRDADLIRRFVAELCELIEMKRFGETQVVHFGEDERVAGYSMVQLIETSLISAHFANLTNAVYLDVFSCKPYNPQVVQEFSENFFEGSRSTVQVSLRR